MYITLHIIWKLHETITTETGIVDIIINIIIGWGFRDTWNKQGQGKCYQPSQRPRMMILTETSIIWNITKTKPNNCFITHCFQENNDKHTVARNLNWYCHRKSCIIFTTNSLFSCLLADNQLICRLCWFPKLAVGSRQWEDRYWVQSIIILIKIIIELTDRTLLLRALDFVSSLKESQSSSEVQVSIFIQLKLVIIFTRPHKHWALNSIHRFQ